MSKKQEWGRWTWWNGSPKVHILYKFEVQLGQIYVPCKDQPHYIGGEAPLEELLFTQRSAAPWDKISWAHTLILWTGATTKETMDEGCHNSSKLGNSWLVPKVSTQG